MTKYHAPWRVEKRRAYPEAPEVTAVVDAKGHVVADDEPYYPAALDPELAHLVSVAPEAVELLRKIVSRGFFQKPLPGLLYEAKALLDRVDIKS